MQTGEKLDVYAEVGHSCGLQNEENLFFIDVWDEMLLRDGKANPNFFVEDGLHMNREGYKLWKKKVKPLLMKHFATEKI